MAICGPSGAETVAQGAQQSLAMSMQSAFQQRFAAQDQLLASMNSSLSPVLAAGPEQQGFSAEELAAKNTAAINNAGAANRNAQQAAGNALAGQGGGGTSGLQSGITQAIKAGISSSSANELAGEQNQITQQNYDVGRQNYSRALAGEQALGGLYNPQSFGNEAETGLTTSFNEANQINQQSQAGAKALAGGLTSLAKTGLGFATGGISNVLLGGSQAGSDTGGGVEQFFSGGLNALNG